MPTIPIFPNALERGTAPEALRPDQARILEFVEVDWFGGRLRRSLGMARGNGVLPGQTYTVWSAVPLLDRQGNQLLVLEDTNGTVQLVPAPLPEWSDVDCFGDGGQKSGIVWTENFDEDGGVP